MKLQHLSLLCDPKTRENCRLSMGDEVVTGTLRSASNDYPVRHGIPRFVDDGYSASFGYQWNRWARVQFEDESVGGPMENHIGGSRLTGVAVLLEP